MYENVLFFSLDQEVALRANELEKSVYIHFVSNPYLFEHGIQHNVSAGTTYTRTESTTVKYETEWQDFGSDKYLQ